MEKTIKINSVAEMTALGERLGKYAEAGMIIALTGDLGAGKTTLTKGIGKGLDVIETINSPTFTILKVYHGRLTLYHFDAYRLYKDSGDDYLEEYFYEKGVSVIEWASNVKHILPDKRLNIQIKITSETRREVIFSADAANYINIVRKVLT